MWQFFSDCLLKKEIKDYKKRLEESVRKKWPDQEILFEEIIFDQYPDDPSNNNDKKILIFIDKELDIDWIVDVDLDQDQLNDIAEISAIESLPHKQLPKREIIAFKRILGKAILLAIYKSTEQVVKQKKIAQLYIEERITEQSRMWTLLMSLLMILFPIILLCKNYDSIFAEKPSNYALLLSTAIAGVCGSYISLVQRASIDKLNSSSGIWLHFLEILSKFFVGAFSGVVSYYLAKSPFAPGSISSLIENIYGIFSLAFVAGFSERMIPRMISTYDSKIKEND